VTAIFTASKDKEFLERANAIIEKELDNFDFSVQLFAESVHLSQTMLYKKIKGITGYSPNEFIRIVRLKRAACLLKTTELNISEIAYKVGFDDPLYFSRCFKQQFLLSPKRFRRGGVIFFLGGVIFFDRNRRRRLFRPRVMRVNIFGRIYGF
jgi:AraC-like DNA-binding protein